MSALFAATFPPFADRTTPGLPAFYLYPPPTVPKPVETPSQSLGRYLAHIATFGQVRLPCARKIVQLQ